MAELAAELPEGVEWDVIAYDPTVFVRGRSRAVIITLLEAIALVVIVVVVFLQTWRASLIPLLAVPVSIVGTFAVLWLLGYSINVLTLFGWCWRSASWSTTPSSWWRTSSATSRRA
jgi:multidrug efflux pump subunit AcrB